MADMPWFPMWATDFVNARRVRLMTPEEVGVYILLLCHQWTDGPLPLDVDRLPPLCNNADVNTVRTVLERCFVETDDGWVNERLEDVRAEQEEKREQKVRAGKLSAKARRRKKLEQRSSSVATALERSLNESESESESDTEEPKKKASPKKKRASQLPDDWKPNDHHAELARAKGVVLGEEAAHFKDYHLAKGSTFKDWDRAFNTWIRNAKKFQRGPSPGSQAATVRQEKPKAETPRQTQGLEHVSGAKPPDRNDEADAWLEAHPDEAEELLRECQDEMGWVLENTKRRDHAEGMVRASLRRKALERIDGRAA